MRFRNTSSLSTSSTGPSCFDLLFAELTFFSMTKILSNLKAVFQDLISFPGRRKAWDDEYVLKRKFSALIPAFDPRPGRTNVNQTTDLEVPVPGQGNEQIFNFSAFVQI